MPVLTWNEEKIYKDQLEKIFASSILDKKRRFFLIQYALNSLKEDLEMYKASGGDRGLSIARERLNTHRQICKKRFEELKATCSEFECVTFYQKTGEMRKTKEGEKLTKKILAKYTGDYAAEEIRRFLEEAGDGPLSYSGSEFYDPQAIAVARRFIPWLNNEAKQFRRCRTTKDIENVLDGKDISKKHYLLPCFFKNESNKKNNYFKKIQSYQPKCTKSLSQHRAGSSPKSRAPIPLNCSYF
ncbi:MAG: hypothetical protein H2069_10090 [Legionella sp.]|nr:hypothetical protein [Legionella sp.]